MFVLRVKSTLEPCNIFGWDMYFVSIDARAQVANFTHFIHMWTLRGHIELFGTGFVFG